MTIDEFRRIPWPIALLFFVVIPGVVCAASYCAVWLLMSVLFPR